MVLQLIGIFAPLSLVAVGGGFSVMPEIQRQVVDVHGWMTAAEFAEQFALAQAAPGPNILVVSLIGWKVAGWLGGVVALLAMTGPSSLVALGVALTWRRYAHAPWLRALQLGLAPVAVGFVLASGLVLAQGADTTLAAYAVTAVTAAAVLRGGIHPLLLMLLAALVALVGWL